MTGVLPEWKNRVGTLDVPFLKSQERVVIVSEKFFYRKIHSYSYGMFSSAFSDACIIFRFASTRRQVFPPCSMFPTKKNKKVSTTSMCRMATLLKTYGNPPRRNFDNDLFIADDGLTILPEWVKSPVSIRGHGG